MSGTTRVTLEAKGSAYDAKAGTVSLLVKGGAVRYVFNVPAGFAVAGMGMVPPDLAPVSSRLDALAGQVKALADAALAAASAPPAAPVQAEAKETKAAPAAQTAAGDGTVDVVLVFGDADALFVNLTAAGFEALRAARAAGRTGPVQVTDGKSGADFKLERVTDALAVVWRPGGTAAA